MYLFDSLAHLWPILIPLLVLAGLATVVWIPPSNDALDDVRRHMRSARGRLAERAREYQRLRRMELPR